MFYKGRLQPLGVRASSRRLGSSCVKRLCRGLSFGSAAPAEQTGVGGLATGCPAAEPLACWFPPREPPRAERRRPSGPGDGRGAFGARREAPRAPFWSEAKTARTAQPRLSRTPGRTDRDDNSTDHHPTCFIDQREVQSRGREWVQSLIPLTSTGRHRACRQAICKEFRGRQDPSQAVSRTAALLLRRLHKGLGLWPRGVAFTRCRENALLPARVPPASCPRPMEGPGVGRWLRRGPRDWSPRSRRCQDSDVQVSGEADRLRFSWRQCWRCAAMSGSKDGN